MELNLELILNTNVSNFEQWLRQFVPSSIRDYVDDRKGKLILDIGYPTIINKVENKFVKILGSPYLKEDSQGIRSYNITVAVGELDSIEEGVETETSIPLLRIFETIGGKTNVVLYLMQVDLYLYIKDLAESIARLWPETKRAISSIEAINYLDMDNVLFDFVIEAEPQNFMEWIHAELGELYPGVFTREIRDHEILTHTRGDYFPPDYFYPVWEYVIYAHDTKFGTDEITGNLEGYEIFDGAIARIELRHIVDNKYLVKCFCGSDHPQILQWLKQFENRLMVIYQPLNSNRVDKIPEGLEKGPKSNEQADDLAKDAKVELWETIPDHLWDREAVEMWCKGHTNREIAQRVCVSPERVTNRISELRSIFGSSVVPYDEQRRKTLLKTRDEV